MQSLAPLPAQQPSPAGTTFSSADYEPINAMRWPSPPPRKAKAVKRSAPEPLIITKPAPATSIEWKKKLAEIKRDYLNHKYQQCHSRCGELLEAAKNLYHVEAVYIIYIRFYAASAIEMQVRSLPHNSPYRTKLLLQAREHYRVASDLSVEEDASLRRPSSRSGSPVPSLHSPLSSNSSYSTSSTRMSSPAPSVTSLDGCMKNPNHAPKPKKRVAFCDVPSYEPAIRPDSPTLGFDDWGSRQPTPEPEEPVTLAVPAPHRKSSTETSISFSLSPISSEFSQNEDLDSDVDHFLHARSIHHYCTILNSLQRQITTHISWLDRDIIAALNPTPPRASTDAMRSLELRARIERLRASGWKRQRFDAQRYEALRERALADIK